LWWAVDHATNTPLAFTFGTREHKNLNELLALLKPFPIGQVYADHNFAYEKLIPQQLVRGKRNTKKIERDHLTLRTRIKRLCRKTICFSKNEEIHKAAIGTFINLFFFGRQLETSTILWHHPNFLPLIRILNIQVRLSLAKEEKIEYNTVKRITRSEQCGITNGEGPVYLCGLPHLGGT